MLKAFPGQLQQQALLWIKYSSFPGRDSEKLGIKLVYSGEHPRRKGNAAPRLSPAWMAQFCGSPALRVYLGDEISALTQGFPQPSSLTHVSRKSKRITNDRNFFICFVQ